MNTVGLGHAFSNPSGDPVHTRLHVTEVTHEEFFLAVLSIDQASFVAFHTARHDQCAGRDSPCGAADLANSIRIAEG